MQRPAYEVRISDVISDVCAADLPHAVVPDADRGARRVHRLGQDPAGERAVDPEMALPGDAGRGDLPAEKRFVAEALQSRLHRVALGAALRPQILRQRRHDGPGLYRQCVVYGTSCSVRVDFGSRSIITNILSRHYHVHSYTILTFTISTRYRT